MSAIETFRKETRAWLQSNCPESMRVPDPIGKETFWGGRDATFISQDQKIWFERMVEKQWTVPYWPKEYGGGGLDDDECQVLNEEMSALSCRTPLTGFGIWMLGPVLLKYGTEEQKKKYVREITEGQVRWCQGYSEPGAGSDLASLRTQAVPDGDDYVITGSKIWTSYAHLADAIFMLARTSSESKHGGISFMLVHDMKAPGIQVSPIELISGQSQFCETHFEGVRTPKANLIGEENQGWEIAMYLLQHERANIGKLTMGGGESSIDVALKTVGLQDGKLADPLLRQKLAQQDMRGMALRLTGQRVEDESGASLNMGHASAALKYNTSEWNKARHELNVTMTGFDGLAWEGDEYMDGYRIRSMLRTKANSIEGGTGEIQLNIISKRILGLPKN
ncbi:MAG: acyl-CoA dehydrogenase family protein [Chloroflexota bacterium]